MAFIEVTDISKKYGRKQVLTDINFTAEKETVSVLWEQTDAVSPRCSRFCRADLSPMAEQLHTMVTTPLPITGFSEIYRLCSTGQSTFANLTVMDNLKLWYCDSSRDLKQDIESGIIKDFKIDSFIKSKVANLSGGMKKRLSIACALATDPQILIMDEPGASLDIIAKMTL